MSKLTIEIPDELMSRLKHQGYVLQDVVVKALENYLEVESQPVTKTRTWELCGSLQIAKPEPEYIVGRDEQDRVMTNYAENVDNI